MEADLLQQVINGFPMFAGLVIAIGVLNRELNRTHREMREEIQRLQAHNNQLLAWCRRCDPGDNIPPLEPESPQQSV